MSLATRLWSARLAPHRATALPAVAAAIGLLLAIPALLRPAVVPLTAVPPGDVALVNGEAILQSDFVAEVEAETAAPFDQAPDAKRAQVLHDMIDAELLVQRGLALDLPETDEDVRQAFVIGVEAQVSTPVLAARIGDADLAAFFAAHRADYATDGTMRIRNIVLHFGGFQDADQSESQALQDAQEAAYQLRAGQALPDVMAHYGFAEVPKADPGDQFDFAAKIHLGDALFTIAHAMNSGDISDPVVQPDGVHILVMAQRNPPRIASFERVRASVYTAYRTAQQKRAEADNLSFLRRNAQILLAPGSQQ